MNKQIVALIGAAVLAAGSAHAKVSQQTLDNLNAASQGESNAGHICFSGHSHVLTLSAADAATVLGSVLTRPA